MSLFVRLSFVIMFHASCVQGLFFFTNYAVQASGSVTCNGDPMPLVDVVLMDGRWFFHTKMGQKKADANGAFRVSGSRSGGKPQPYIRVLYSYSGSYGKLKVVNSFSILRKGKTSKRSYNSNINFGTINFNSVHCKAYVQFYKALKYYNENARSSLPYSTLFVETNTFIHGGTPYATTNTVRIPPNYPITYKTAQHEFAHTIRHSFDGSFGHFLIDVARYVN